METLKDLAFTVDEYRGRLARIQAAIKARGLEALLLHDRGDIAYLTGMFNGYMTAYYAALVPAQGEPVLIASEFEILNARLNSWCDAQHTFPVPADPIEATCRLIEERLPKASLIGVQHNALTAAKSRALAERLGEVRLKPADDLVWPIMVIKSPAEVAYLREAARLSALGMQAALDEAAPGTSENDLAAAASGTMIRGGSEFMCIEPFVTSGRRSGVPHSTYQRRKLEPGDATLVEVGACFRRYTAPLMRTIALRPVPADVLRAANACRDSLNALIDHMRPGAVARDAALAAKQAWLPISQELIWHGIYAYSVGLSFPTDWNDAPLCITESDDFVLQPGMVFHATTSLRRAAEFATALSETVLITPQGNEVLSDLRRELWVV